MEISRRNYLGLDFDGVIADSILECLLSGLNAYAVLTGRGGRQISLVAIPAETIAEMRRLRNYIRSGEDYVYIALAMDKGCVIRSQNDFDRFVKDNIHFKSAYYNQFYQERSELLKTNPEAWLSLNPLYPGMAKFLDLIDNENLFIITTKETIYVHKILSANGIGLERNNVFRAVGKMNKQHIINKLMVDRKFNSDQIIFIDDHIDTLKKVASTGVECILAAWGYNTLEQQKEADDFGIMTYQLKEFLRLGERFQIHGISELKSS